MEQKTRLSSVILGGSPRGGGTQGAERATPDRLRHHELVAPQDRDVVKAQGGQPRDVLGLHVDALGAQRVKRVLCVPRVTC